VVFEGPDHLVVREQLRLDTVWINEGGPGQGVRVSAWGPVLDEGLLELTHAVIGPRGAARQVPFTASRDERGLVLALEVEDLALGAAADGTDLAAAAASMVSVRVEGAVLRRGRGELTLAVCPADDDESDVLTITLDLR
jgi:hypothetical protein